MSLPVDHLLAGAAAPPPCAAALAEIRGAGYEVANVIEGREVPTGHSVQLGQVIAHRPKTSVRQ